METPKLNLKVINQHLGIKFMNKNFPNQSTNYKYKIIVFIKCLDNNAFYLFKIIFEERKNKIDEDNFK